MLAQHYAPENVSGAVLATELSEDLSIKGHKICVVTCVPNYPEGKIYKGYRSIILQKRKFGEVLVIRVWSLITASKNFWMRILHITTFSIMSIFGGLVAGKPDVIFSYSPPLPLGISSWILSRLWKVPWILRVEDLYPDIAIDTGVLRNSILIRFSLSLEKFLYHKCTLITVISNGFKRIIHEKGIDEQKILELSVWADPNFIQPGRKYNSFRKLHGLENQFLVLYAGNIGQTSSLDDILIAAEGLRENLQIRFVVIGEGIKKADFMEIIKKRSLNNVLLLPFQPRELLSEVMAAADVGLVTINSVSGPYSLPSKVFSVMASGRPILSIAPSNSDLARLVCTENIGINVAPNDSKNLEKEILYLFENPIICDVLGKNGRDVLVAKYSRVNCTQRYEEMITKVCQL